MVAAVEIDRGGRKARGILPGRHRVAEGQCIGARAAGVGCGAAVVEGQRRRATAGVDGHRFAHVERQRYRGAGSRTPIDRVHHRRDSRRRGIDLRAGLGQAGQRRVGGVAAAVRDGRPVEIERGRCKRRRYSARPPPCS